MIYQTIRYVIQHVLLGRFVAWYMLFGQPDLSGYQVAHWNSTIGVRHEFSKDTNPHDWLQTFQRFDGCSLFQNFLQTMIENVIMDLFYPHQNNIKDAFCINAYKNFSNSLFSTLFEKKTDPRYSKNLSKWVDHFKKCLNLLSKCNPLLLNNKCNNW